MKKGAKKQGTEKQGAEKQGAKKLVTDRGLERKKQT